LIDNTAIVSGFPVKKGISRVVSVARVVFVAPPPAVSITPPDVAPSAASITPPDVAPPTASVASPAASVAHLAPSIPRVENSATLQSVASAVSARKTIMTNVLYINNTSEKKRKIQEVATDFDEVTFAGLMRPGTQHDIVFHQKIRQRANIAGMDRT